MIRSQAYGGSGKDVITARKQWDAAAKDAAAKDAAKAEAGDAQAQYALGYDYYSGEGVERNLKKAFKYYYMASLQGVKEAQYNLARCYYDGEGVKKNRLEGLAWMYIATSLGAPVDSREAMKQEVGEENSNKAISRAKEILKSIQEKSDNSYLR